MKSEQEISDLLVGMSIAMGHLDEKEGEVIGGLCGALAWVLDERTHPCFGPFNRLHMRLSPIIDRYKAEARDST